MKTTTRIPIAALAFALVASAGPLEATAFSMKGMFPPEIPPIDEDAVREFWNGPQEPEVTRDSGGDQPSVPSAGTRPDGDGITELRPKTRGKQ